MKPNSKISAAVGAVLGASASMGVWAADAAAESSELTEVVVTANRRVENLQDVPITIQAISGAQLQQLNVVGFNDLLKYTPNVTYSGNGPGTGNIYMRGLGGTGSGNQSQSTTAPFPNVALYLDDQSMQFPARNNDVYLVDMERVEVLEGPQGTLFGGGAQAGAIRYITNKPNLTAISGEFNAGYGITTGGDPNSNLNATLNVPIIDNVLAVRAVIFNDHHGGYIDNVPATVGYLPGSIPHDLGGNPSANNGPLVGNNLNDITVQGARLSALWKINDQWDALLQQNFQHSDANGYFYAYPLDPNGTPLQKYQITAFTPAFNKDKYGSTAWTLNGKIGNFLGMVYTGSYMTRNIEGQQDYSNYMRSLFGSFYACIGTGAGYFNPGGFPQLTGKPLQCTSPVGSWNDKATNAHQSHELRFTTPAENRIRALVGGYWEKFVIHDNMNFNYLGIPQCDQANLDTALAGGADCLSAVGPFPGTIAMQPGLRLNSDTAFGEDVQRGYTQKAAFASLDFDIIPKVLTISGGIRYYHYDEFEHGSEYYSETHGKLTGGTPLVVDTLNGTCINNGYCAEPINLDKTESGHRLRGNLTWHITDDVMAYYTYSEGFRPGGFNRTYSPVGTTPVGSAEAPYSCVTFVTINGIKQCQTTGSDNQYQKPVGFDSDQLTNNEVGLKSEWFSHHLLFNLSLYQMDWKNVQLSLFDPQHLGNTTFNVNGPAYRIRGFEVQFVARLMEGLTLEGSTAVNTSEQTNAACLKSVVPTGNPTPIGQCITQIAGLPFSSPFGAVGDRAAFSPPWMFNVRARYEWVSGSVKPFAWVGASHIGPQSNEPASFPSGYDPAQNPPTTTYLRYDIPSVTTYDAAIGFSKDQWNVQIQGSNLTNEYGPSNISSGQFIESQIPLRPRVISFMFGYSF